MYSINISNNNNEILLTCPFCNENDFDKIGLKIHLEYFCEEYKKIDIRSVKLITHE